MLANGTKCDAARGIVNLRVGTAGGNSDNCKAIDPLCPNDDTMSFMPLSQAPWRQIGAFECVAWRGLACVRLVVAGFGVCVHGSC